MEDYQLGPNGGLVFCMESLLENIDWLLNEISQVIETYSPIKEREDVEDENEDEDVEEEESLYLIIDCPGQVSNLSNKLYSHRFLLIPSLSSSSPHLRLNCTLIILSFKILLVDYLVI